MKQLFGQVLSSLLLLTVALGCLGGWQPSALATGLSWNALTGAPTAPLLMAMEPRNRADDKLATEFGKKIDLNNTNIRAFMEYPGLYPTLARKILQNAPFESVDDVLEMPDLTDRQLDILQANMDRFTLSAPEDTFVEGGDRFNNGIYR
ncbi:MAG: photosystem II complex extrinsic protein PsbU [Pegethrix bostrychoides GSE-TBD4-15B]|uniref:Photosystem II extrinsic protein U n=1 Tax=Pegethrix bostrychoides GSE-TBD4-15B TaxID=2839662 RepID=A0A951PDT3_9CYAN|nr:photosystem II complex extrinsic protein PsbU [Pegethrix bostrychoides GSE-TBD4-15B]